MRTSSCRRWPALVAVDPASASTATSRRRCARRSCGPSWLEPGRGVRACRPGLRLVAPRSGRPVREAAGGGGRAHRAFADAAQARLPRGPGRVPGRRALVAEPGRPRQPQAGGLGSAPPGARGAASGETAKLQLIRTALAEGIEGDYEPVDAGPGICAFTRGERHLVAVPVRLGAMFEPPRGWRPVLPGLYAAVPTERAQAGPQMAPGRRPASRRAAALEQVADLARSGFRATGMKCLELFQHRVAPVVTGTNSGKDTSGPSLLR